MTIVLIGGLLGPVTPAHAGTDDYPYKHAVYVEPSTWSINGGIYSGWGFAYRNCTDFVTWRMRNTNGVDFYNSMRGGRWGNANNWDDNARALGYAVNSTPARGAIAQTDAGTYGHVAWVDSVNADGTVTVEEYNWATAGSFGRRTVAASTFRYIHVKDLAGATNPFGALDGVSSPEPGVISVGGWAADADSKNGPLQVHVYWNDRATAITANKARPDVAAAFPGYGPNLGYAESIPIDLAGDLNVCTYAINVGPGDTNTQLGCKRVQVDNPNPFGQLDAATGLAGQRASVRGWAADPNLKNGLLEVHFYANDKYAGKLTTGVSRLDVSKAYPGYGDSLGYEDIINLPIDGSVNLCAYAINAGPGWINTQLGCKSITVPHEISGTVPSLEGSSLEVGSTLAAVGGDWSPAGVAIAYQWLRDGQPIVGATQSRYTLTGADLGKKISATVTGSKAGYASLSYTSSATAVPAQAFADVPATHPFFKEIGWLAAEGISTGTTIGGKKYYKPAEPVNRDAMAAFMYRMAGSPVFTPPTVSPFKDVTPSTELYKEIPWLASKGISTGWDVTGGKEFRPLQPVNRDAMAAFMYRYAGSPAYALPSTSPFKDMTPTTAFYMEVSWLASKKISTGWDVTGGKEYRPVQPVNRDAMAAFMYRLKNN